MGANLTQAKPLTPHTWAAAPHLNKLDRFLFNDRGTPLRRGVAHHGIRHRPAHYAPPRPAPPSTPGDGQKGPAGLTCGTGYLYSPARFQVKV